MTFVLAGSVECDTIVAGFSFYAITLTGKEKTEWRV